MGAVFGKRENSPKILMVGLDAAGKTTTLYKLKLGEVKYTIPTIGFNVESLEKKASLTHPGVAFTVFDVGGRDKIRPLLRFYYEQCNSIVFVVDSNDRERMDDAREQLDRMLDEDELFECPLLVFANKQDLPGAMTTAELVEELGLNKLRRRAWYIQSSVATTGEGLWEGLDWLQHALNPKAVSEKASRAEPEKASGMAQHLSSLPLGLPTHAADKTGPGSDADTASTAETEDIANTVETQM